MKSLCIRDFQASDTSILLEIYKPFVTDTVVTFEEEIPSHEAFEARLLGYFDRHPVLVAEAEGEILGFSYATQLRWKPAYRWTAESTIYLKEEARGTGVGQKLYGELLNLLTYQNVCTVYGVISLPGNVSCRFHEKFGFKQVALLQSAGYKLNRWVDIAWYVKELNQPKLRPNEFIPANQLRNRSQWEKILSQHLFS